MAPSFYSSLCAIISLTVVLTLHDADASRRPMQGSPTAP